MDTTHLAGCPKRVQPAAHCQCEAIEDALVARSARRSPAQLIRDAKAKGLIKGVVGYTASP